MCSGLVQTENNLRHDPISMRSNNVKQYFHSTHLRFFLMLKINVLAFEDRFSRIKEDSNIKYSTGENTISIFPRKKITRHLLVVTYINKILVGS